MYCTVHYLFLKFNDKNNLHGDLRSFDNSIDNVKRIGKILHVSVEGASDDGEVQIQIGEEGRESEQGQVKVGIGSRVGIFVTRVFGVQVLDLTQTDQEGWKADGVGHRVR